MTIQEFEDLLKTTGLPVAYRVFDQEMTPPYIAYLRRYADPFAADGKNYVSFNLMRVDLYTAQKDEETERKVEAVLEPFGYAHDETYLDDECLYMNVYELEI